MSQDETLTAALALSLALQDHPNWAVRPLLGLLLPAGTPPYHASPAAGQWHLLPLADRKSLLLAGPR